MSDLNILIVEGNIREDSEFFIKAAGASAADNLKNLILKLEPSTNTDIINPGHDDETANALENMSKYSGIVFTGGAMRINDMTNIIKKHIKFASNCFNEKKKILAICWGLQVCSTAAAVEQTCSPQQIAKIFFFSLKQFEANLICFLIILVISFILMAPPVKTMPEYLLIFSKAFAVSSSCPGFMISVLVDGSNFNIKFFKLSAAEAPAALIKNSLSSLIFPSTIKIFKSLI